MLQNIYQILPEYKVENTINSNYKGNPQNANMATQEVHKFIKKNELTPIGSTHQVINNIKKEKKNKKKNQIDIDVYVEVS